jgi:hypothetical protein
MKIHYTQKLFYKTHAFKVTLGFQVDMQSTFNRRFHLQPELQQLQDWCTQQFGTQYKMINRGVWNNQLRTCETSIYVGTQSDKDLIVQHYASQVLEVWQPMDQSHQHALSVRNITQVRTRLIYNKYSHVIYFKYDKTTKLKTNIEQLLHDSEHSVVKGSTRWPRMYSTCEQDVAMVRLTYTENIDYIKHVILFPTK